MCDSGSGWQSGISSLVRFAAMIPASCAVTRASPFGNSRRRRAVSGAISTLARATARRRDRGLAPTSTMRTSPPSLRWLSSVIPGAMLAACRCRHALQGTQLRVEPLVHVVLANMRANRIEAASPLTRRHGQGCSDRSSLPLDVEGVDGQRPIAELGVGACVFRKDNDSVVLIHERRFLRDEIHAVEDCVDEQHVELLVRSDGAREVVGDLEVDRLPSVLLEAVVDATRLALDRSEVFRVLGNVLS